MVRSTVEETLSAMLDAEADQLDHAPRVVFAAADVETFFAVRQMRLGVCGHSHVVYIKHSVCAVPDEAHAVPVTINDDYL